MSMLVYSFSPILHIKYTKEAREAALPLLLVLDSRLDLFTERSLQASALPIS